MATPTLTAADAADLFRTQPDRWITAPTGDVAHRRVGQGPDVLFVHGWPVHGATYRRLLPYLVDHVTCHVIDLPGTGSSRFTDDAPLSIAGHIEAVRAVVDELGLDDVALVGHDSGGMIARHAMAGDPRLRSMGLIDTEQPQGLSFRFKMFLAGRNLPGFGGILGWLAGQPRLRRNGFVLGDAFADRDMLDGDFDEFFLQSLRSDRRLLDAGMKLLKSFDHAYVDQLGELHQRIDVPVGMVWGAEDKFFPLDWAREMVDTFPNATLEVVEDAGLFAHEEKPAEVASALLPVLAGD